MSCFLYNTLTTHLHYTLTLHTTHIHSAIFWFNHHADLSWDPNTLHGACHVKKGIKYVAQRWIRWHTSQTSGFNPLQHALDRAHHLNRALDEQKRLAQASKFGLLEFVGVVVCLFVVVVVCCFFLC